MLSANQNQIRILIETGFTGADREEALLYHVSVERKLESVKLWLQNVETSLPDIFSIPRTYTTSTADEPVIEERRETPNLEPTIIRISAYIDAFFMSGKSTLDTFAHEIRHLYDFGGHTGNLYFYDIPVMLRNHHSDTELHSYINSINLDNLSWYKDLSLYRKASTHESIIQIKPTLDMDFLTTEWRTPLLKLPLDTVQKPLQYNGKNFIDTGGEIRDKLFNLVIESYDKILNDINNGKTRINL